MLSGYKKIRKCYYRMKGKCYNVNDDHYKYYGKRGIKICDEWLNDFQAFYEWSIENGYNDNLTLDRIDVNGNYEPDNCRWITQKQQTRNRRYCKYYTINNKSLCLGEWCEILNLDYKCVWARINQLGWSVEKALGLE